jgi:hypothetical protein
VVTHGKQRGVLASTKKIGHLLRKKHESRRDLDESLQLKEKKIKVSRAGFTGIYDCLPCAKTNKK